MPYIWQEKDWPNLRWKDEELTSQLGKTRYLQGKLISRASDLGFDLGQEAAAEILVEEAVTTSAIEGESIDKKSVRSSVARQLGLPLAGLPTSDRRAEGLVQMLLDATVHHSKPLTAKRLKGWHAALFPTGYSGIHRVRVGKWRGKDPMRVVSGPIGKETIHFEAPPQDRVEAEIKEFLSWWKKSLGTTEGLLRAGIAHFYFVTIHPFEDGNGRIARALTDMAMAQDEKQQQRFYSMSSQIMSERNEYYDVLESSQKGDCDITEWLKWFLKCTERAVEKSEVLVLNILQKAEFWKRHGQTQISDRQRKIINRLLDAGPGGFEGGLTTRKYVSLAKVSRATAYREIADLEKKGILRAAKGRGRSASYDLVWP
jgi:Fic family protein